MTFSHLNTSGSLLLVFFRLPLQKLSCRFAVKHVYCTHKMNNVRICIKMNFHVPVKQCGLSFSFHRCRSFIKRKIHTLRHVYSAHSHTHTHLHLNWREQHFQRIFQRKLLKCDKIVPVLCIRSSYYERTFHAEKRTTEKCAIPKCNYYYSI